MSIRTIIPALSACLLAAAAALGEPPTSQPDDLLDKGAPAVGSAGPATRPDEPAAVRRDPFKHIRLDKDRRRIYIESTTLQPGQPLELIACSPNSPRQHEAIVVALARPSHIHLTLLAAGFESGHPISYDEKADKVIPPTGARVDARIRWTDPKTKKQREDPVEYWMRPLDPAKPMPELTYLFTGSMVLEDGRYLADLEGSVISLVNFADAVMDLPGLHSDKMDMLEFEANPKTMPPANTGCTLILLPPPDLRVGLDRFGKVTVEGQAVAPDRLGERLAGHRRSRDDAHVVLTASPDAVDADVEKLIAACRKAGFDAEAIRRRTPATRPDELGGFPTNDPRAAVDLMTGQWREHRQTLSAAAVAQREWLGHLRDRTRLFARQYTELADYVRQAQDEYRQAVADRRD